MWTLTNVEGYMVHPSFSRTLADRTAAVAYVKWPFVYFAVLLLPGEVGPPWWVKVAIGIVLPAVGLIGFYRKQWWGFVPLAVITVLAAFAIYPLALTHPWFEWPLAAAVVMIFASSNFMGWFKGIPR